MKAFEFTYIGEKYIILALTENDAEEYFSENYLDETEPEELYEVKEILGKALDEGVSMLEMTGENAILPIKNFIEMAENIEDYEPYCLADTVGFM